MSRFEFERKLGQGSDRGLYLLQLAASDEPHFVVYEDAETIPSSTLFLATEGHTLVIAKRHAEDIWAIGSDGLAVVARATHTVSELLRQRLGPDGMPQQQPRNSDWEQV